MKKIFIGMAAQAFLIGLFTWSGILTFSSKQQFLFAGLFILFACYQQSKQKNKKDNKNNNLDSSLS